MTTRPIRPTAAILLVAALAALVVLGGCGRSVAGVASPAGAAVSSASPAESVPAESDPAEAPPVEAVPVESVPAEAPPVDSEGGETAAPDGASGTVRYLAMGDSLTQGIGAADRDNGTFPALLAQRWRDAGCEVELKNVGISGYTAAQIVSDEVPEVAPFQPTAVTFQGGGNDIATGVGIDDYRTNVNAVLDAAAAVGATVLVFAQNEWYRSPEGQNYGGIALADKRAAYDQVLIEAAAAHGARFVDLRALYKAEADQNLWAEDGLHPTPQAYVDWSVEMAAAAPAPCR